MESVSKKEGNTVSLAEDNVYFGGMNLNYRLLVCTGGSLRRFRIHVCKDSEFDEVDVGTDLARALAYYQSIVCGIVTPCTLKEVLRELQYA